MDKYTAEWYDAVSDALDTTRDTYRCIATRKQRLPRTGRAEFLLLHEAASALMELRNSDPVLCPDCHNHKMYLTCPTCNGHGFITRAKRRANTRVY